MFFKRSKTTNDSSNHSSATQSEPSGKGGFLGRIKQGLSRTSNQFTKGIGNLVLGKKVIDDELLEEVENQLLAADVGIEATAQVIDHLTDSLKRRELDDGDALYQALQQYLS